MPEYKANMPEPVILSAQELIQPKQLKALVRMNVLQHEVLKIDPKILTQRDIKNLYKARARLNVVLEELFECLDIILESENVETP